MSKKDYTRIAAALKSVLPMINTSTEQSARLHTHAETATRLAETLASANPKFDRNRFLVACGVQS